MAESAEQMWMVFKGDDPHRSPATGKFEWPRSEAEEIAIAIGGSACPSALVPGYRAAMADEGKAG
jgi:hypothetical protein